MSNQIRLLLADDHAVVRSGLRMLLEAQPDMVIVGEAETGQEAIRRVAELSPDVVLMDIEMPGMNGIEATRRIKADAPASAILGLTMYEDDQYFFEMLRAGASGYVPKRAAPDELVSAIRAVSRGEVFLYPSLAGRLVQDYLRRGPASEGESPDDETLTPREQEVLTLLAEGFRNNEIADRLVISAKTVDRHRENIHRKLKLNNQGDLWKDARRKGFIGLDE